MEKKVRKKILILANSGSGLYSFRKELIFELIKQNYEIIISVPNLNGLKELEKNGARLIITKMNRRSTNPFNDFKLFLEYKNLLKNEKPDLIITYTIKPNIYGGMASRSQKTPYIANITGLGTGFQGNYILYKLIVIMYKMALKAAKTIFFENIENQQIFLNKKIIKSSQACLLNGAGVNLEYFTFLDYPKEEKIKFLFIGRVMKEKGINELLTAMENLANDELNVELHVLGNYEEDYKSKFVEYEKIGWLHYHGLQKDIRPYIRMSHCQVLPSWHEGMANTNLECAASGRPIITSNIHGCKEAVIDGVSGFLVERKNAGDLYKVMKKFTELSYKERSAMGLAGRKHMEDVFDKKKVVAETLKRL